MNKDIKYYKTINYDVYGFNLWKFEDEQWYIYTDKYSHYTSSRWVPANQGPKDYLSDDIRYGNIKVLKFWHDAADRPMIKRLSEKEAFIELL